MCLGHISNIHSVASHVCVINTMYPHYSSHMCLWIGSDQFALRWGALWNLNILFHHMVIEFF
jgi:hypothetical protein